MGVGQKISRQIVELALERVRPKEISQRLDVYIEDVYSEITAARKRGVKITPFNSGRAAAERQRARDINCEIEKAYGLLWRDTASSLLSRDARLILLGLIDKEGQKRGIDHALKMHGPVTRQVTT